MKDEACQFLNLKILLSSSSGGDGTSGEDVPGVSGSTSGEDAPGVVEYQQLRRNNFDEYLV